MREQQRRLYMIRLLERQPSRLAHLKAQALKRKSEITFPDEEQTLPEVSKYIDCGEMETVQWTEG